METSIKIIISAVVIIAVVMALILMTGSMGSNALSSVNTFFANLVKMFSFKK